MYQSTPMNKLLRRILFETANELDARYGPHPHVPKEKCKEIAREITKKIVLSPDEKLFNAVDDQIDKAFGRRD